ncbi:MAG: hypothetical protein H7145_11000 [Akkermansiaceae bacterium]|nr:hypothetical protein [Armatimonadota bacterium]
MRVATEAREYADGEVARIGRERYERELQPKLDIPENRGRLVAIHIESGDYALGRNSLEAYEALHARRPGAPMYLARIGSRTAVSIGGGGRRR